MRKFFFGLGILLLALTASPSWADYVYRGTVQDVGANTVWLATSRGLVYPIQVAQATFMVDDRPV